MLMKLSLKIPLISFLFGFVLVVYVEIAGPVFFGLNRVLFGHDVSNAFEAVVSATLLNLSIILFFVAKRLSTGRKKDVVTTPTR